MVSAALWIGQGNFQCIVSGVRTLKFVPLYRYFPLHPEVSRVSHTSVGGKPATDWHPISGTRNTLESLHAKETGNNCQQYGPMTFHELLRW